MALLEDLAEDILYLILEHLDTARDRAHLAQTCRTLHQFMEHRGWRSFARTHFPSIFANRPQLVESFAFADAASEQGAASPSSSTAGGGWRDLAESLTWQSRAWDRRSVSFQGLLPRNQHIPVRQRPRAFRPALAAHFQPDRLANGKKAGIGIDGEELLVWGAGEDIVARYRVRRRGTAKSRAEAQRAGGRAREDEPPLWEVLHGKAAGFRAGSDDVRTVTVVENAMGRAGCRGVLAGRDSGDLSLLSAEPGRTFGRVLARFRPGGDGDRDVDGDGSGTDLGQNGERPVNQSRIYSVDVSTSSGLGGRFGRDGGVAAVTTPSHVVFYPVPQTCDSSSLGADDAVVEARPVAAFAMGTVGLANPDKDSGSPTDRLSYNARWTTADGVLAVGVSTGPDPLRYLTVTPSGAAMELTTAYRSADLYSRFHLDEATRLLPTALEPLVPSSGGGGGGHLMLSGWRDGTVRLQDLRTASPWDLVYQDNIMGSSDLAQTLLYLPGTDRFVAGIQASAVLRTFDLRWPRRYYHTDALQPCSDREPQPEPDLVPPGHTTLLGRPSHRPVTTAAAAAAAAAVAVDRCCRWHTQSRALVYRSTCSFYLAMSLAKHTGDYDMSGVWSLCNSGGSELAPANLYAGFSGCVVETVLSEYDAVWVPKGAGPSSSSSSPSPSASAPRFPPSTVVEEEPGWTCHSYYGYRHPARRDDPHFGYAFGPSSGYAFGTNDNDTGVYRAVDVNVSMMETGDSMRRTDVDTRPSWLPSMRPRWQDPMPGAAASAGGPTARSLAQRETLVWRPGANADTDRLPPLVQAPLAWQRQHRFDPSFQRLQDFAPWHNQ